MPIYTVQSPDGKTYDIEGPEGATPEQLGSFISSQAGKAEPYDVSTFTKRAMQLGQGATFGFGDELAGKLGLDKARYNATLKQHSEEEPIGSVVSNVIGGFASPAALLKVPQYLKKAAPVLELMNRSPVLTAGGTGLVYGGLQAAGDSEGQGIGGAALQGGGVGAGLGIGVMGATKAVSPMLGALGNGLMANAPKAGEKYSTWLARNRVADAFNRDNVTIREVRDNLHRLGGEARFADAAGENTRGLLDLNANLPGRTKDELETLIRNRIATRPDRMDDVVYSVNGGYGRAGDLSKALEAQKLGEASPLYENLHQMSIPVSGNLKSIFDSARQLGASNTAKKIATAERTPFTLASKEGTDALMIPQSSTVSMRDADLVKRGIDTMIERETDAVTGKVSTLGRSYVKLKKDLLDELDNLTIDPKTGSSLYKSARDAFAGPAAHQTAIKKGRAFWNDDAERIESLMDGMSASEKEAFRVGASEKLREMVGTQTGQNRLLNFWKDRNTREKLKSLLGNDVKYNDVEKMLKSEETLKRLESLGASRNSRTFSREAASDQQNADNAVDLVSAGLNVKSGGLASMVPSLIKTGWKRSTTPEPVRNSIGNILMSKYSTDEMKALEMTMEAIKARQRAAAVATGAAGGQGSGLLDF